MISTTPCSRKSSIVRRSSGTPSTGTSTLGSSPETVRNRVPKPPHRMTAWEIKPPTLRPPPPLRQWRAARTRSRLVVADKLDGALDVVVRLRSEIRVVRLDGQHSRPAGGLEGLQ